MLTEQMIVALKYIASEKKGASPSSVASITALEGRGLVVSTVDARGFVQYVLTDAGRRAVANVELAAEIKKAETPKAAWALLKAARATKK